MRKYSVSMVRERLSEALDEAERGVPVVIERKGVRYRLTVEPTAAPAKKARRKPLIEVLDPAILDGWTWEWSPGTLTLKTGTSTLRRSRRRK